MDRDKYKAVEGKNARYIPCQSEQIASCVARPNCYLESVQHETDIHVVTLIVCQSSSGNERALKVKWADLAMPVSMAAAEKEV